MSDHDGAGDTVPWRAFLAEAEQALEAAAVGSPAVDARRIVEQASGYEGAELWFGLDEPATLRGVAAFDAMLARRVAGEPLQYVLGRWSFRSLDLFVDRRVLIPRPETEVVAGIALEELARVADERRVGRRPADGADTAMATGPLVAVDLGTGSGAIGLSIAAERDDTHVVLTDASADALAVATANLAGLGRAATRVRIAEGSWFAAVPSEYAGAVDLVVSNPPYVAVDDELPAEVAHWEPRSALIAGPRGIEDLEIIVAEAFGWLRPRGALVLEMAPHQTAEVVRVAESVGYVDVVAGRDLTGRDRWVRARR